jgi:unsaturated rhamnogalacturonyl hydrolase
MVSLMSIRIIRALQSVALAAVLAISAIAPGRCATDWGKAVANSTMARFPDARALGWDYHFALYLHGQYLLYKRTGDTKYYNYVLRWGDTITDNQGNVYTSGFRTAKTDTRLKLDNILGGMVMMDLYQETRWTKFRNIGARLYGDLAVWPRTTDGGFWHGKIRPNQLWLDGAYMALPFMLRYGRQFGTPAAASDEVTKQLSLHIQHMKDPVTGLLYHGYDETGTQSWADPVDHHSPEFWCRADGWHLMTVVDVLDMLPVDHPKRQALLDDLGTLAAGLARFQDPVTGRWFEVLDKGARTDNWTETSCSAMIAYGLMHAVNKGYVPVSFKDAATKGYQGVLKMASIGSDGRTNIANIVTGAIPGSLTYYLSRPRATNDWHGLGAFLVMYEEFN